MTLHQSPAGRVQVKARIVRDRGRIAELRFEKVTGRSNDDAKIDPLLTLNEEAAARLIELCYALKGIDPTGGETLKLDDDLLAAVMADPNALTAAYDRDPEGFAEKIKSDVAASDVIAIAARKQALERFEILLDDPGEFERARDGGGKEAVWQRFFEENPWILGVGLSGRLFTSWDETKFERVVGGSTVANVGKRVDALLTTSGAVRSLVLAEIKLHDDPLLEKESYRSGCWAPSHEVTREVAQTHITADRARGRSRELALATRRGWIRHGRAGLRRRSPLVPDHREVDVLHAGRPIAYRQGPIVRAVSPPPFVPRGAHV